MTFLYAIILLGVIIFVHELGHFLFAKLMRVRVLKFSLGFGPKLIGKKYGDTEYLISSIPFGGYVKMLGETREDELREDEKPYAYNNQPVWKRFIIVLAGPLFNIIFAAIIFFFIFLKGLPVLMPEIGNIMPESPAERAGLREGDKIVEINGINIYQWHEMTRIIHGSPERLLDFTIERANDTFKMTMVPEKKIVKDFFGEEKEIGLIGIMPSGSTFIKQDSVIEAFVNSITRTLEISVLTVVAIVKLIQRVLPMDTIGGPILIVQMAGEQASQGLLNLFVFMAIINVNLGILNLLPIPILDGGHILFLGIEAIRGKPLNEKVIAICQRIGLAFILILMFFVLYNDIMRLITGKTFP
ncbi:MAG: RIP metalloprotease RseP [Nitrospirae bacterium]|jgi:regulator of sigma E protease|nr:RIP metalloprotease RseP [Nitrospirota bacterium]